MVFFRVLIVLAISAVIFAKESNGDKYSLFENEAIKNYVQLFNVSETEAVVNSLKKENLAKPFYQFNNETTSPSFELAGELAHVDYSDGENYSEINEKFPLLNGIYRLFKLASSSNQQKKFHFLPTLQVLQKMVILSNVAAHFADFSSKQFYPIEMSSKLTPFAFINEFLLGTLDRLAIEIDLEDRKYLTALTSLYQDTNEIVKNVVIRTPSSLDVKYNLLHTLTLTIDEFSKEYFNFKVALDKLKNGKKIVKRSEAEKLEINVQTSNASEILLNAKASIQYPLFKSKSIEKFLNLFNVSETESVAKSLKNENLAKPFYLYHNNTQSLSFELAHELNFVNNSEYKDSHKYPLLAGIYKSFKSARWLVHHKKINFHPSLRLLQKMVIIANVAAHFANFSSSESNSLNVSSELSFGVIANALLRKTLDDETEQLMKLIKPKYEKNFRALALLYQDTDDIVMNVVLKTSASFDVKNNVLRTMLVAMNDFSKNYTKMLILFRKWRNKLGGERNSFELQKQKRKIY